MPKYKAPKGEENFVHLEVLKKEFDRATGKLKFEPYKQILSVKEYESFLRFPNGLCITNILHLPKDAKEPKDYEAEFKKKGEVVLVEMFDLEAKAAPADDKAAAKLAKDTEKLEAEKDAFEKMKAEFEADMKAAKKEAKEPAPPAPPAPPKDK